MEVGSRLRRSCSLSQGQSVLPPMLVVTATPQSLVSNLEWKRYRLHEILPFTNLCWPLVGVLDFPCWAARVENICRLSSIHFSFLPGLSRPHLSVLPWLQVWFCPQRGVFCLSASSLPSPHLRPTLPHPFLRVCPQPPQHLSLNHSGFCSLAACTPLSAPVTLSWLQFASGNMFPKGRTCVRLRPALSPHT